MLQRSIGKLDSNMQRDGVNASMHQLMSFPHQPTTSSEVGGSSRFDHPIPNRLSMPMPPILTKTFSQRDSSSIPVRQTSMTSSRFVLGSRLSGTPKWLSTKF